MLYFDVNMMTVLTPIRRPLVVFAILFFIELSLQVVNSAGMDLAKRE